LKRNISDDLVEKVRAEWDEKSQPPAAPQPDPIPDVPSEPPVDAPKTPVMWTFPEFMAAVQKKQVSSERIHEACTKQGVSEGFTGLARTPERIYLVAEELKLEK
jgi:hypothetical protein